MAEPDEAALSHDACYKDQMAVLAKIPVRMSVAQFLNWDSQDGLRYELVDGEPRAMAQASTIHGFVQNELGSLIRTARRGPEQPIAVTEGELVLESVGFRGALVDLYARTGLAG
jgi:Uma2 family endonuclease